MHDNINHPSHYNWIEGIECVDVAEHMTYNLGCAVKYIWRCGKKSEAIEDIEKAIWYLNREVGRLASHQDDAESDLNDAHGTNEG